MMRLVEYQDETGESPFSSWFDRLDAQSAAKVVVALSRLEQGNTSNVKSVGTGVRELKLNVGPGYRIYFATVGRTIILLLGGGTKQRQSADIERVVARWQQYKKRAKET